VCASESLNDTGRLCQSFDISRGGTELRDLRALLRAGCVWMVWREVERERNRADAVEEQQMRHAALVYDILRARLPGDVTLWWRPHQGLVHLPLYPAVVGAKLLPWRCRCALAWRTWYALSALRPAALDEGEAAVITVKQGCLANVRIVNDGLGAGACPRPVSGRSVSAAVVIPLVACAPAVAKRGRCGVAG